MIKTGDKNKWSVNGHLGNSHRFCGFWDLGSVAHKCVYVVCLCVLRRLQMVCEPLSPSIFPSTGGSFEKPLTFKCLLQQMGKDPTIIYSIQTWAFLDKHCPLLLKQGHFNVFAALD